MPALSRIEVKSKTGFIKLCADDLSLDLSEKDSRNILDWLVQSLDTSILFLLKVDGRGYEIEWRNYANYLDVIVFEHAGEQMRVRTFNIPKVEVHLLIEKLSMAISTAFA
ncbi:hypothetical protein GC174_16135 [bacterium]|nr:hypothetical protein [bacterium]